MLQNFYQNPNIRQGAAIGGDNPGGLVHWNDLRGKPNIPVIRSLQPIRPIAINRVSVGGGRTSRDRLIFTPDDNGIPALVNLTPGKKAIVSIYVVVEVVLPPAEGEFANIGFYRAVVQFSPLLNPPVGYHELNLTNRTSNAAGRNDRSRIYTSARASIIRQSVLNPALAIQPLWDNTFRSSNGNLPATFPVQYSFTDYALEIIEF